MKLIAKIKVNIRSYMLRVYTQCYIIKCGNVTICTEIQGRLSAGGLKRPYMYVVYRALLEESMPAIHARVLGGMPPSFYI